LRKGRGKNSPKLASEFPRYILGGEEKGKRLAGASSALNAYPEKGGEEKERLQSRLATSAACAEAQRKKLRRCTERQKPALKRREVKAVRNLGGLPVPSLCEEEREKTNSRNGDYHGEKRGEKVNVLNALSEIIL